MSGSYDIECLSSLLHNYYGYTSFVAYDKDLNYLGAFNKSYFEDFSKKEDVFLFKRCTGTVFKLLYNGISQTEIKELLFVSKSWVSKMVKRIQQYQPVREYAEVKGFLETY